MWSFWFVIRRCIQMIQLYVSRVSINALSSFSFSLGFSGLSIQDKSICSQSICSNLSVLIYSHLVYADCALFQHWNQSAMIIRSYYTWIKRIVRKWTLIYKVSFIACVNLFIMQEITDYIINWSVHKCQLFGSIVSKARI